MFPRQRESVTTPFGTQGGVGYATAYGNGVFVVGGQGLGSGNLYYSTDGKSWTKVTNAFADGVEQYSICNAIIFAGGKFVAVGQCNGACSNYWYSTNGKVWNEGNTATASIAVSAVTYGRGINPATGGSATMFVAAGTKGWGDSSIKYSLDGITWLPVSGNPFSTGYGITVAYTSFVDPQTKRSKNIFIAGGSGRNTIWLSENGTTWTTARGTPFGVDSYSSCFAIEYGSNVFVALGTDGYSNKKQKHLMYSANGYDWSPASGTNIFGAININPYGDILYANGLFIATSNGGGVVWTSTDGKSWTTAPATSPFRAGDYGNRVAYISATKTFVIVGYSNGTANIWTSTTRNVWTNATASFVKKGGETPYGNAVVYASDKKLLVATGFGVKKIISSTDGKMWS